MSINWNWWRRRKQIGLFTAEQVARTSPKVKCRVRDLEATTDDSVAWVTLEITLGPHLSTEVRLWVFMHFLSYLENRRFPATLRHHRRGLQVTSLQLAEISPKSDANGWTRIPDLN